MAMSAKRRHYRSRAIAIITSAVHVSIKTALLESLMKKASGRPLLSVGAVGNEVGLRYGIDKIKNALPAKHAPCKRSTLCSSQFCQSGRGPGGEESRSVSQSAQEDTVQYFDEAKKIWKTFVPKSGQSETVQGELLRAIEKLREEAIRNGNGNWDDGFEILLDYLKSHILDPAVYQLATINATKTALARLGNYDNPYLEDDLYDELSDRVVEYFKFYGSRPHAKNTHLHR
jgi:hypothetical protein